MIGRRDRAFAEIDRRREWLVGLCQEIVRRPTENPPGTTTACADLVTAELPARGLPVERFEPRPGLVSLVSSVGSGDPHFILVEDLVRVTKVHMATALEFVGGA